MVGCTNFKCQEGHLSKHYSDLRRLETLGVPVVSGFKPPIFDAYYYGITIHVVCVACSVAKVELSSEGYYCRERSVSSLPDCGFHLGSKGLV